MSEQPNPTGQEQCTLPADLVQRLVVAARHVYPLLCELMKHGFMDGMLEFWRLDYSDPEQEDNDGLAWDVQDALASVLDEVEAATKKHEEGS